MSSTSLRVGAQTRARRAGPTTAGAAPAPGFRADIQGLRAVAVLLVLLSHYFEQPAGGFIGVDVFFVLSGFLITGLLLREHDVTGRISLRGFYARRARRILPVGVLVIAVTSAVSYLLLVGGRAQQVLTDALWATGFAANIHFQRVGTDYFQDERPPSPLQHYWSLAVEEQFYVLWPLVLLLALGLAAGRGWRRPRAVLAGVTAAVFAGSLWWSLELTASSPTVAYFSTVTRAWELGVGALLALAHRPLLTLPTAVATALSWAGLVGLVMSAVVIDGTTPFPGAAAIAPVLATAALLVGGMGRTSTRSPSASWGLCNAVSGYLGQISYSLYLWHWPVLVLAEALVGDPSAPVRLLLLASSVGLAVLSFHLVERPVLRS